MAKKYSLIVEKDRVISVEVDGVRYDRPEKIPNPADRARIEQLLTVSPDLRLATPAPHSFGLTKFLFALFLGIAVLMLAIAAVSAYFSGRTMAREQRAPGQVFDLIAREDDSGNTYYYPVIEYYLPDASRVRIQLTEGSWPPAYEKGQPVTVLYDPAHPSRARIDSFGGALGLFVLPIITGILGAAFLAAAIFARWMDKQTPSFSEPEPASRDE